MRSFFHLILVLTLGLQMRLEAAPMTLKELEFMVRQRTPEAEVLQEVTRRRLIAPLTADVEAQLKAHGSSEALLAELKKPSASLSAEESKAEQQRMNQHQAITRQSAQEDSREIAAIETRKNEVLTQLRNLNATKELLDGKLVRLEGDQLKPFHTSDLNPVRIYAFYFSAKWCGPCRAYTPKLVEDYKRIKAIYPEFELIFVSNDRDEFNMAEYMRGYKMPWPAVRFDAIDASITQYSGSSIPWLVAISDSGKPLTQNGIDKKRIPPPAIIDGIESLLKQIAPNR